MNNAPHNTEFSYGYLRCCPLMFSNGVCPTHGHQPKLARGERIFSGEVWCTCGIDEVPSVPDPRVSWRHASHCAHGTEKLGRGR